ncbi:MAG: DNA polymerase Y family protein [Pseudomonadota bacterium]
MNDHLWLYLSMPHFAIESASRTFPSTTSPIVISDGDGVRAKIHACDRQAFEVGIYAGMPLGSAWALVSELKVFERNIEEEDASLKSLAAWAYQFTSMVNIEPPSGLLLEVGGSAALFGSVRALVKTIKSALMEIGYTAKCSLAPTPTAAIMLGDAERYRAIWDCSKLSKALASIPVDRMRLPEKTTNVLKRLGVQDFQQCRELPREALVRRTVDQFSAQNIADLIDRALGKKPDPREAYIPPEKFERMLSLPDAVDDVEALIFPLRRLLKELCGYLMALQGGVQEIEIRLRHFSKRSTTVDLQLMSLTRDDEHLTNLLREKLSRIVLSEAVEQLGVTVQSIQSLGAKNLNLFQRLDSVVSEESEDSWRSVLERLSARLGHEALQCLESIADHRPERAWKGISPQRAKGLNIQCAERRPLWLLPEAIALDTLGGRPYFNGLLKLTTDCERIEAGWWDGHDIRRDYFVAENEGGEMLWIYRDRRDLKSWYLHGVFS